MKTIRIIQYRTNIYGNGLIDCNTEKGFNQWLRWWENSVVAVWKIKEKAKNEH